jgi:hypothetical protein
MKPERTMGLANRRGKTELKETVRNDDTPVVHGCISSI